MKILIALFLWMPLCLLAAGPTQHCNSPILEGPTESKPNKKVDLLLVYKSQRRLLLITDGEIQKQYRVALGFSPLGHKIKRGDGKTPEGRYRIELKNPRSEYHLSLRVSYPDALDAESAKALGVDPGDDIMVHGFPNDPNKRLIAKALYDMGLDWTLGCIAVTNEEIEEIYAIVDRKTPIEICP